MSARSQVGFSSALIAAVFLGAACRRQDRDFWREGGRYRVTLVSSQPVRLIPEVERVLGKPKDSVEGRMTVDSMKGDSVWGAFSIPLTELGLMIPTIAPGSPKFAGRVRGDSFRVLLNSHVTDAGVWLEGMAGKRGWGSWMVPQRTAQGTFHIEPSD